MLWCMKGEYALGRNWFDCCGVMGLNLWEMISASSQRTGPRFFGQAWWLKTNQLIRRSQDVGWKGPAVRICMKDIERFLFTWSVRIGPWPKVTHEFTGCSTPLQCETCCKVLQGGSSWNPQACSFLAMFCCLARVRPRSAGIEKRWTISFAFVNSCKEYVVFAQ